MSIMSLCLFENEHGVSKELRLNASVLHCKVSSLREEIKDEAYKRIIALRFKPLVRSAILKPLNRLA